MQTLLRSVPLLALLLCAACATSGRHGEAEDDPPLIAAPEAASPVEVAPMVSGEAKAEGEFEVPAVVAESEHREPPPSAEGIPELVVEGRERQLVTGSPAGRRADRDDRVGGRFVGGHQGFDNGLGGSVHLE